MKNNIKLLRIISTLDPRYGGPSRSIVDSSVSLVMKGIKVDIVTNDPPGSKFYRGNKINVINIGSKFFSKSFNPFLFFWVLKNKKKYSDYIIHGIWEFNTIIAKILLKKKYYVFIHGQLDPYFKNEKFNNIKKNFYWFLIEKRNLLDAKSILLTSENEKKLLNNTYVNTKGIKRKVVNYGIQEPQLNFKKITKKFDTKFKLLKNKKFFLFLGRFHKKKGCEIILHSMKKIIEKNNKIYLLMAGPKNDYRSKLIILSKKLKINKNIIWTDFLQNDFKWASIKRCYAMVLPSHGENFGVSVVESLALGKTVLISNKVNIFNYIKKTRSGLVSTNNVNNFSKIMIKFIDLDIDKKKELNLNAKRCFKKYFDFNNSNEKLISLLKKY